QAGTAHRLRPRPAPLPGRQLGAHGTARGHGRAARGHRGLRARRAGRDDPVAGVRPGVGTAAPAWKKRNAQKGIALVSGYSALLVTPAVKPLPADGDSVPLGTAWLPRHGRGVDLAAHGYV